MSDRSGRTFEHCRVAAGEVGIDVLGCVFGLPPGKLSARSGVFRGGWIARSGRLGAGGMRVRSACQWMDCAFVPVRAWSITRSIRLGADGLRVRSACQCVDCAVVPVRGWSVARSSRLRAGGLRFRSAAGCADRAAGGARNREQAGQKQESAPSRIRTYAPGSGGQCSIP